MNIQTENDHAYIVECECGHVFADDGRNEVMHCPACHKEENTMQVAGRWWASAGWRAEDLPVLAPAASVTMLTPVRQEARRMRVDPATRLATAASA